MKGWIILYQSTGGNDIRYLCWLRASMIWSPCKAGWRWGKYFKLQHAV